jgi:hypothetical protein
MAFTRAGFAPRPKALVEEDFCFAWRFGVADLAAGAEPFLLMGTGPKL